MVQFDQGGQKKMDKLKARRARNVKFRSKPRKFKTVDDYINTEKMRELADKVTEKAKAYKLSTQKLEKLCDTHPDIFQGWQAGALLVTAINNLKKSVVNNNMPEEALQAAEDYSEMRVAMDEFINEGKVPGSLVLELSRRVLDAEIKNSVPIVVGNRRLIKVCKLEPVKVA